MAVRRTDSIISFIVIISIWEITVKFFNISPFSFPGPGEVGAALWEMGASGALFDHIVASLYRVTWGYYLAVLTAVPFGLLLGSWAGARKIFNPLIQFLRPISPLAWIPVALIWFGIGDRPAIFLIFLSSFFPMVVFTMSGVQGVRRTYLRVADNFGLTGPARYFKVILPASMPEIVVGLRITLGTAWLVIVAAEMIAVKSGLGFLIVDARNALRMDRVIAGMLTIGVIGLCLDWLIRQIENIPYVQWSRKRL